MSSIIHSIRIRTDAMIVTCWNTQAADVGATFSGVRHCCLLTYFKLLASQGTPHLEQAMSRMAIYLYRETAIAIEGEARDSNGGNARLFSATT